MTTPPRDEAVVPMWGGPKSRPPNLYLYPAKWEAGCVEYRALPAAAYAALVAENAAMLAALENLGAACEDYCYYSERDTGGGAPDQYEAMKSALTAAHVVYKAVTARTALGAKGGGE